MAIVKAKQKRDFLEMPNTSARDKELSLEAKGLLCVLLSMDDDWKIYKRQISDFSTNGIHSTRRAFNELIEKRYIIDMGRQRDEKGLLKESLYYVYQESQPMHENRTQDNRTYGNRTLRSNTINSITEKQEEEKLKEHPEPTVSGVQVELFVEDKPVSLYQFCVDVWLKRIHPGWTFGAVHGQKMKSIISKLRQISKNSYYPDDDKSISELFIKMVTNLPEYYQDKDLQIIDSKFNEIITEIKNGKATKTKQSNYTETRNAFSEFA